MGSFRLGALRTAILSAGVLALSAWRISGSLPTPGFAAGLLVAILVDLLPMAPSFVKTFHYNEYYAPEPLLETIATDTSTFRVADLPGSIHSGGLMLYNLEAFGGFADNEMAHMQEFRGKDWQRTMQGLVQNPDGTVQGSRILDLLNVKYLLYRSNEGAQLGAAVNRSVLPRARLVDRVVPMPLSAQLAGVLDSGFDHRGSVLIDPEEISRSDATKTLAMSAPDTSFPGTVTWTRTGTDRWTYVVDASRPALLVLAEPWYPFWKASIGGASVPMLRVNYALRAVPVPKGRSTVELSFHSDWGELANKGMAAAAGVLALWMVGWILWSRRRTKA